MLSVNERPCPCIEKPGQNHKNGDPLKPLCYAIYDQLIF